MFPWTTDIMAYKPHSGPLISPTHVCLFHVYLFIACSISSLFTLFSFIGRMRVAGILALMWR